MDMNVGEKKKYVNDFKKERERLCLDSGKSLQERALLWTWKNGGILKVTLLWMEG